MPPTPLAMPRPKPEPPERRVEVRRGACVEPARGFAELDPPRELLFFVDAALPAPLFEAEPLPFVAPLERDEPRPPLVVRLAMPHTVTVPTSPVTPTTDVFWRGTSREIFA
jgi:hypothetical protein